MDEAKDVFGGSEVAPGDVPFEVEEVVEVGDLSDVKEESRPLVPPTKNVKVTIRRATRQSSKGKEGVPPGEYKWLNLGVQIVDGIDEEGKYKGAYINTDNICFYANPEYYPKAHGEHKSLFFGKLADLQRATDTVGQAISDQYTTDITGKSVLCNIVQSKDMNGEPMSVAKMLRVLPIDQQV